MDTEKPLKFRGTSYKDLMAFPRAARREAGFQLGRVQGGKEPADWKPMATIGVGVREIRIREDGGAFRVIYIARFGDAIYVLHCFEKKSQTTAKTDIDLAATRFRQLERELKS